MRAYRVGDGRLPLLTGEGAALYGGRWNSAGRAVVYASLDLATAMLEYLAASNDIVTRHAVWIEVTIPDTLTIERIATTALRGWDADPPDVSRLFGDRWIDESRSVALIVPSVVVPIGENVVLHAAHPDVRSIVAGTPSPLRWDRRLVQRTNLLGSDPGIHPRSLCTGAHWPCHSSTTSATRPAASRARPSSRSSSC